MRRREATGASSSGGTSSVSRVASPTTVNNDGGVATPGRTSGSSQALLLVFCTCGVYFFYLLHGLFQEKINTTAYGEENVVFSSTLTLLLVSSIINAVAAGVATTLKGEPLSPPLHDPRHSPLPHEDHENASSSPVATRAPPKSRLLALLPPRVAKYAVFAPMALTYILAMFSSNLALHFVNYPTQVLGKSCKMVPVMLGGALIARKPYPLRKWIAVSMVTLGISGFMLLKSSGGSKGGHAAAAAAAAAVSEADSTAETAAYLFGLFLVFFSLAMDGVTGGLQDKLSGSHGPSSQQLMFLLNAWSAAIVMPLSLITGDMARFVQFSWSYPSVLWDVFGFAITSAAGQFFVFTVVRRFSPLTCTTITTTRKFFGIITSVLLFGHHLNIWQWGAAVLVFAGLCVDMFGGRSGGHGHGHGHGNRDGGDNGKGHDMSINVVNGATTAGAPTPNRLYAAGSAVTATGTPLNAGRN